ncbi:hypothetical protein [Geminocystis sp. NIES-3709]|uniref:hypothetical protein n=1 Tax=Geminocystis sp. NIES-3709 TaxID=1617448 RepID=UPI0008253749|nr:hypothetical protein [Geminocystis sp. NIES-3709]
MSEKKQELINLQHQITKLYETVKKLGEYIGWEEVETLFSSESDYHDNLSKNHHWEKKNDSPPNLTLISNSHSNKHHHNNLNSHQDILIDDMSMYSELSNYSQSDNNISCEEQVYRLTAQLTAAYHRIASLEDQLLAIRSHEPTRNNGFYHAQ